MSPEKFRMSAVSIAGVTKQFKGGTTALEGIDLEIESGEFISLIGPSGCGKSTLLRIVGDLIEPTQGTVTVNGNPARQARRDHDYGIVFQDSGLYDWRTVGRNIPLPLQPAGRGTSPTRCSAATVAIACSNAKRLSSGCDCLLAQAPI